MKISPKDEKYAPELRNSSNYSLTNKSGKRKMSNSNVRESGENIGVKRTVVSMDKKLSLSRVSKDLGHSKVEENNERPQTSVKKEKKKS